jgi:hypothetical protein
MLEKETLDYIKNNRVDSIDIQEQFGWQGLVYLAKLQASGVIKREYTGVRAYYVVVTPSLEIDRKSNV